MLKSGLFLNHLSTLLFYNNVTLPPTLLPKDRSCTGVIIPIAPRGLCNLNINKCCFGVFSEMTDAVVFLGGQSPFHIGCFVASSGLTRPQPWNFAKDHYRTKAVATAIAGSYASNGT